MSKTRIFYCLLLISFQLIAQDDIEIIDEPFTYYDLNLDQVINTKISVSSAGDLTVREAPAIVMVVTSDEIKAMGARDLLEVINLLPGYNFGVDIAGVVGISSRGVWSHEGKILVVLDGQEINDIGYLTSSFGQHFDISLIDRIEILRGPSSSIYGGTAAMGMIKIITKTGDKLDGLNGHLSFAQASNSYGRETINVGYGAKTDNMTYSATVSIANGRRSNSIYHDVYGSQINLTDINGIKSRMLNLAFKMDQLSLRFIYDYYKIESPTYFDAIGEKTEISNMGGIYAEADYEWMNDGYIKLNTSLRFKHATPWATNNDSGIEYYEINTNRFNPAVNFSYRSDDINLLSGLEMDFDSGKQENPLYVFQDGNTSISYQKIAAFAQVQLKETPVPVILGARIDNHSQVGSAYSLKVALSDLSDFWHYKLLFGRSFRAPGIENLRYNPGLKPEYSSVIEAQFGYVLSSTMSLSATYYSISVTDPIVFYFTEEFPLGAYINHTKTRSSGIEMEFRYQGELGFIAANLATISGDGNRNEAYEVSTINDQFLAWPALKVNLYSGLRFIPDLIVSPSLSYLAKRYAVTGFGVSSFYSYTQVDPQFFINLNLQYTMSDQIDLNLYIKDITNQHQWFIQPHNSGFAPIEALGTEIVFGLSFHPSF